MQSRVVVQELDLLTVTYFVNGQCLLRSNRWSFSMVFWIIVPSSSHHWQVRSSLLSIVSPIGGHGTKIKARLSCQFKIKGIVVLVGSVAGQGPDRNDMLVNK